MDIAEIIEARRAAHPGQLRRRTRRPKTMRPIRPRRRDALMYERDLMVVVRLVNASVQKHLVPVLLKTEHEYLHSGLALDAFADEIESAMAAMRGEFNALEAYAVTKAAGFIGQVNRAHQIRYFDQLKEAVGIDVAGIVESEGLEVKMRARIKANVELITSIPVEQFAKIEKMVYENTISGSTTALTMQQEMEEIGAESANRAKFIARDQTAKANADMNEMRNLAVGIKEYVWMATGGRSGDGRTRKTHREHHGRVYTYGTTSGQDGHPGQTGHPGQDYQCRCTARPIVPGL